MANTVHIAGRGSVVRQRRILASPFSPRGHERSPKSAPQHVPTVTANAKKSLTSTKYVLIFVFLVQIRKHGTRCTVSDFR